MEQEMRIATKAVECVNELVKQNNNLRTRLAEAEELNDTLRQEAQMHAQEARTANGTIYEIYQAITGATGEPGNWNGAKPVIEKLAQLQERAGRMEDSFKEMRKLIQTDCSDATRIIAIKERADSILSDIQKAKEAAEQEEKPFNGMKMTLACEEGLKKSYHPGQEEHTHE